MFHRGKVISQIFKHPNFIQKSLDKLNEYCKKCHCVASLTLERHHCVASLTLETHHCVASLTLERHHCVASLTLERHHCVALVQIKGQYNKIIEIIMFHRGKVISQIFKHPNFIQKSLDKLNEYCKKNNHCMMVIKKGVSIQSFKFAFSRKLVSNKSMNLTCLPQVNLDENHLTFRQSLKLYDKYPIAAHHLTCIHLSTNEMRFNTKF
jgi:hypothetical protein